MIFAKILVVVLLAVPLIDGHSSCKQEMKVACYTGSCSGGATSGQSKIYGCYKRGGDVNGEPAWYKSSHSKAIWWEPERSDWVIGDQGNLGGIIVNAKAHKSKSCPNLISDDWKYYDGNDFVKAGRTLSIF